MIRSWAWPLLLTNAFALCAVAQDAVVPGELTAPHPTLQNISLVFEIQGDDNQNATASVRVSESGSDRFFDALDLRRVTAGANEGFSWTNKLAGSIFNLSPNTHYTIEVTLNDPDGGSALRTLDVTTRPVPAADSNARVVEVTPDSFAAATANAEPGDLILMANGNYADFSFSNTASAAQPIVFRGQSQEGVRVQGSIDLSGSAFVFLENLTLEGGRVKVNNTRGAVVRDCRIESSTNSGAGDGIVAYLPSEDGYFADNILVGTTTWNEEALGVNGNNLGEGIVVSGPGNVVAFNRVSGYRDCLSLVEDTPGSNQHSNDFVGNDVYECADDGIEADFSEGNVRVFSNRVRNSFIALSSQPSLGGPTYFIRNVLHNTLYNNFKLNRGSVGDVLLHNTSVKAGDAFAVYAGQTISHAFSRNNLFVGGIGNRRFNGFDNGAGRVINIADADDTCDFDFDGFASLETNDFRGRVGAVVFSSLEEMRNLTSEGNGVDLGATIFEDAPAFPPTFFAPAQDLNLGLHPQSLALGAASALPNVFGFAHSGQDSDLGALQRNAPTPHFGPRPFAICGNGTLERYERCDDGNLENDDGCSSVCTPDDRIIDAGIIDVAPGDVLASGDVGQSDPPDAGGGAFDVEGNLSDAADADDSPLESGCGCSSTSQNMSFVGLALYIGAIIRRRHKKRQFA